MIKLFNKICFWNKKSPVLKLLEENDEYDWIKGNRLKHFYSYKLGGRCNNVHISWPHTDITNNWKKDKKSFVIQLYDKDIKGLVTHRIKFLDNKIIIMDYINMKIFHDEKLNEDMMYRTSLVRQKSPFKTGMEFDNFKQILKLCKEWCNKNEV